MEKELIEIIGHFLNQVSPHFEKRCKKTKSRSVHTKAKKVLKEHLQNSIADLLLTQDFLLTLQECKSSKDIKSIL